MKNKIKQPHELLSYFKAEKLVLVIITFSGIIYNIGMSVGPFFEGLLVQMLYDILQQRKTFNDMVILAFIYIVVILIIQISRSIKRFYVRRFANNVSRQMRHALYNSLVYTPYQTMKESNIGDIMTKAISDVDACVEGMRKFTTEIFDTGVVLVVYVSVMLSYDWKLTLLSCSFIPLAYFIANRLKEKITYYHAEYKKSASNLNNAILDRVENSLTYRIFSREENRTQYLEQQLLNYEKSAVRANIWETSMKPIYHMISMSGVIFLLYFGSRNVLGSGSVQWNLAAFTTYLSCFTKMAVKSSSAAKLMNAIQKAQVSWKRIQPLMKPSVIPLEKPMIQLKNKWQLQVNHLSVGYDNQLIIHDLSFQAHQGDIIGICGPVAAGKTTLGKAFIFEPQVKGEILIDGTRLTSKNQSLYVGYMGHQSELIADTIKQNITLGKTNSIQSVLEFVGLDQEIEQNSEIGEDGNLLSGGQKARLAFARTLYHQKPLLILDDPFASIDLENEANMIKKLKENKNQIILFISHRITHFASFDQVIWLEEGNTQIKTHQEMLKENQAYAHIYQMQGGQDE